MLIITPAQGCQAYRGGGKLSRASHSLSSTKSDPGQWPAEGKERFKLRRNFSSFLSKPYLSTSCRCVAEWGDWLIFLIKFLSQRDHVSPAPAQLHHSVVPGPASLYPLRQKSLSHSDLPWPPCSRQRDSLQQGINRDHFSYHRFQNSAHESDNNHFKQSDSVIIEQKLEKESTESDEQKSSSSGEPKSTSSEPRLGVKQLQLSRTDGNDCSNQ